MDGAQSYLGAQKRNTAGASLHAAHVVGAAVAGGCSRGYLFKNGARSVRAPADAGAHQPDLDEALAEQEGDFDADSRWALAWFEQSGFADGEYGVAETLSKAKNTSVAGLVQADIVFSQGGKVRLLRPSELPDDWNPETDSRLTAWETVHHLIRALEAGGEGAAAALVRKLGAKAETARELCYRLYMLCERKKRAAEALAYNGLVLSWPEISRLAREGGAPLEAQAAMFEP